MSYNGWSNYETWNVALWIDNEEGSYSYWRDQVREACEDADEKDEAVGQIAKQLKSEIEDSAPDLGASMWSDLLSAAISEVDWYEIAENWVDEAWQEKEENESESA